MLLVRRAALALVVGGTAVLAASCDSISGPSPRLNVAVVVDRTALVPRQDTASIQVTVANPTDQRIVLRSGYCEGPTVGYEVRDLDGHVLVLTWWYPDVVVCPDQGLAFRPGESRSFTFRWTGETDKPVALDAGEYRIVAFVRGPEDEESTAQTSIRIEPREQEPQV